MPRGENRPSALLSREENDQVFSMIGAKCQSLATAVVQLFTTEGPAHGEWKKRDTGVLCLIKDNQKRSYFFRMYCLHRRMLVWEHEVYMQIEYKNPRPYLHTFEAEEYMTAFNFANEDEARVLRNILIDKIELRKQRREERQRQRSVQSVRSSAGTAPAPPAAPAAPPTHPPRHNGAVPPLPPPAAALPVPAHQHNLHKPVGGYIIKPTGKKPKPRRFTKADISEPKDFVHVSHIGWDENKGFDVDNVPEEEMKDFFRMAGVSESQLQDQDTREFIYEFINTHGGLDRVVQEVQEVHDTTHHPQLNGTQQKGSRAPAPPPVPTRGPAAPPGPPTRAPPGPPSRAVPPPPPHPAPATPATTAPAPPRNPPPPRPSLPPSSGPPSVPPPPPPPPAGGAAPPPPPPPPPPLASAAPALPHAPAAPADPRSALMDSIRSGNKTLRHVDASSKPPPVVEDKRSDLLSEIRQGIELKSVVREVAAAPARAEPPGMAGALARALEERSRAMRSSDSEHSDASSSAGEWED